MNWQLGTGLTVVTLLLWFQCSAAQNCTDGQLRLVGDDSTRFRGRVEICFNETWGTVCDDLWDNNDARVVCRQLGLPIERATAVSSARFGQGSDPIFLDDVACTGNESRLEECPHRGIGIENCGHTEDAGVLCAAPANCTDGQLRLRNGATRREGRVEVCFNQTWGTVCDDLWDLADAEVTCRQLGLPTTGAVGLTQAAFGQGFGPIFLDNVGCNGTESRLAQCSNNGVGVHDCSHVEDAGVNCSATTGCSPDEVVCRFGVVGNPNSRCLPEPQVCDGNNDCLRGTDEQNCPEIVRVGQAIPFSRTVQEGSPDDVISACVQVLSGNVTRILTLTGVTGSVTAIDGVDFNGGSINLTLAPGQTRACYNQEADGFIIDDEVFEAVELFTLSIFPAGSDERFLEVIPELSTSVVYIVDDEVATIGFERPLYRVREDAGRVELTVTLLGPRVPEVDRPVVFTYYTEDGNATNGDDYRSRPGLQIGSLTREREQIAGDQRVLSFGIVDDEVAERPETFRVRLSTSETGVNIRRGFGEATVIIMDNDGAPPPRDLDVRFSTNTPSVVGNRIEFQVVTNRAANVRCRVSNGVGDVNCPVGETVTIDNLAPGNYLIRVTAAAGRERDAVSSNVAITGPGTCTANFVGNGVTVDGDAVTIEFASSGIGPRSFTCSLDRGLAQPCESPYTADELSEGRHRFRINVAGRTCQESVPFTFQFDIEDDK